MPIYITFNQLFAYLCCLKHSISQLKEECTLVEMPLFKLTIKLKPTIAKSDREEQDEEIFNIL